MQQDDVVVAVFATHLAATDPKQPDTHLLAAGAALRPAAA